MVSFLSIRVSLASCDEYKKLVAFVMSYSFTDESAEVLGRTMMVPFVDLLNHSSRHHVELTFHPNHLTLVAVRDIEKVCETALSIAIVMCRVVRGRR